ncbi:putative vacuole morphology and inheritance protein [Dioscorea sansibarensis]
MSPGQPHYRKKGGMVGLAVLTIALTKKIAALMLYKILPPILDSFRDSDVSVCEYACETICVIAMVVQREIYLFFDRIFYAFCLLFKHPDIDQAFLYEKLPKITEYMGTVDGRFSIEEFVQFLKEGMRKMFCSARVYLLRWIENKSPHNVDSEWFLELYVEGLFQMLTDLPDEEGGVCDNLDKILQCIKEGQYRQENVDFGHFAEPLLHSACSEDQVAQSTALTWINEFRKLGVDRLAPFYSRILCVILPCFSVPEENICEIAHEISDGIRIVYADPVERLEINAILTVLKAALSCGWKDCQIEALIWITKLLEWHRDEVMPYLNENFDFLITTLSDPSDEVVLLVLEVHACIATDDTQFNRLFASLTHNQTLWVTLSRGSLIVRRLCALLNAEQVFRKFSSLLEGEDNLESAFRLVETLNYVLVTASELADMRALLKQTLVNDASKDLFISLHSSWCHSPSATISLCLFAQEYRHAYCVIQSLFEKDILMMPLVELADLVYQLQIPCFDHIKLQLRDAGKSVWLRKLLYRILMLLPPKTTVFPILWKRMRRLPAHSFVCGRVECLPYKDYHQCPETSQVAEPGHEIGDAESTQDGIDFASLLEQYKNRQRKHFKHAKTKTQLQSHSSASSS